MRKNKFSDLSIVSFIIVFILIIFFIINIIFINKKLYKYKVFDGVFISNNVILIMVKKSDIKYFYSNSNLYINNKKYKYSVYDVNDSINYNNTIYREVFIKINNLNGYKSNDVVRFSIFSNKFYCYKIFNIILG